MALPARVVPSFDAIKPVPNLNGLDGEFNQLVGATGLLNGNSTGTRILTKYSNATEPVLEVDQLGAGLILQGKQNGAEKFRVENDGDIVGNGITGAAGVYTFGSIPVGPASDPTTANQLARKAYVDARKTYFAISWFIDDPSTYPVQSFVRAQKVRMPGNAGDFVTTAGVLSYATGSASGSFTVQIQVHDPNNQGSPTIIGTITVNSGTVGGEATFTMSNQDIAGKYVYIILDARSSPLQKDVSITLHGEQKIH